MGLGLLGWGWGDIFRSNTKTQAPSVRIRKAKRLSLSKHKSRCWIRAFNSFSAWRERLRTRTFCDANRVVFSVNLTGSLTLGSLPAISHLKSRVGQPGRSRGPRMPRWPHDFGGTPRSVHCAGIRLSAERAHQKLPSTNTEFWCSYRIPDVFSSSAVEN